MEGLDRWLAGDTASPVSNKRQILRTISNPLGIHTPFWYLFDQTGLMPFSSTAAFMGPTPR
jgi:hypothetical protein